MAESNRPISPHLQVYRLPLTGVLSISHRIAGVLLALGLLVFCYGLLAIAQGEESFTAFQSFSHSFFGQLILYGWLFALFYHFCHGIRHIIWDFAKGFDQDMMDHLAILEIVSSIVLFILAILLAR